VRLVLSLVCCRHAVGQHYRQWAPAAHLRAAAGEQRGGVLEQVGSSNTKTGEVGDEESDRRVVKPAGRTDQGEGDEDQDEEEEPARPVEAPKVPKAAPTNSYVTKTHTRYIKAAVVEAYKKQHAHDLPTGQDLATWAPMVVASGAVVREVVGMCQEKFPDKKAVFTEASVRKKYNGTRQQACGGKGKGKGSGQGPEGGQSGGRMDQGEKWLIAQMLDGDLGEDEDALDADYEPGEEFDFDARCCARLR